MVNLCSQETPQGIIPMKFAKLRLVGLVLIVACALGLAPAHAAKPAAAPSAPPLSAAGVKLEAEYESRLAGLEGGIKQALPDVDKATQTAYAATRMAEEAAKAALATAQQRMGEIGAAQGLVAHAKGKWIDGADKGIAAAKAKLAKAMTDADRQAAEADLANWQKNRAEGEAALVERQARLDKAMQERDSPVNGTSATVFRLTDYP